MSGLLDVCHSKRRPPILSYVFGKISDMPGPDTDNASVELAALELRRAEDSRRIDELEARVALNREVILELQGDGLVAREQVQDLEAALESARVIGAAVGIVMASTAAPRRTLSRIRRRPAKTTT